MKKQKIIIFDNLYKEDLEKEVNDWLNNKNNKDIKVLSISASNKNQYGGYIAVVHYEYEENLFNEITPEKNIECFSKKTSLKSLHWEKITIECFFENCEKKKLCVHCDTVEKAKKFTEALIKFKNTTIGPLTSEQIRNINCYWTEFFDIFKEETCYQRDFYCYKEWYLKNGYTIYEFEDIIFE